MRSPLRCLLALALLLTPGLAAADRAPSPEAVKGPPPPDLSKVTDPPAADAPKTAEAPKTEVKAAEAPKTAEAPKAESKGMCSVDPQGGAPLALLVPAALLALGRRRRGA